MTGFFLVETLVRFELYQQRAGFDLPWTWRVTEPHSRKIGDAVRIRRLAPWSIYSRMHPSFRSGNDAGSNAFGMIPQNAGIKRARKESPL